MPGSPWIRTILKKNMRLYVFNTKLQKRQTCQPSIVILILDREHLNNTLDGFTDVLLLGCSLLVNCVIYLPDVFLPEPLVCRHEPPAKNGKQTDRSKYDTSLGRCYHPLYRGE